MHPITATGGNIGHSTWNNFNSAAKYLGQAAIAVDVETVQEKRLVNMFATRAPSRFGP